MDPVFFFFFFGDDGKVLKDASTIVKQMVLTP